MTGTTAVHDTSSARVEARKRRAATLRPFGARGVRDAPDAPDDSAGCDAPAAPAARRLSRFIWLLGTLAPGLFSYIAFCLMSLPLDRTLLVEPYLKRDVVLVAGNVDGRNDVEIAISVEVGQRCVGRKFSLNLAPASSQRARFVEPVL